MNSKQNLKAPWSELRRPGVAQLSFWAERILNHLLPRHCIACGMPSGSGNLCNPCNAELPRYWQACRKCGLPLYVSGDWACGVCLKDPPPWQSAIAGLAYRFPVDQLVCRFKFKRDLACGQILGAELLAAILQHNDSLPQVIVPVPLHRSRQLSRSFNQAELLARQVGRGLRVPVQPALLSRLRRTSAQSGLDARERKKNIKGAFSCQRVVYQHVALLDDVMTTGATLAECTRALQQAGVSEVSVWVAARADNKHPQG